MFSGHYSIIIIIIIIIINMFHSRCGDAGNLSPIIRWQQTTSDFKDSSEDPCWSQQLCLLEHCQFYSNIDVC